jgi:hypothetical protein
MRHNLLPSRDCARSTRRLGPVFTFALSSSKEKWNITGQPPEQHFARQIVDMHLETHNSTMTFNLDYVMVPPYYTFLTNYQQTHSFHISSQQCCSVASGLRIFRTKASWTTLSKV